MRGKFFYKKRQKNNLNHITDLLFLFMNQKTCIEYNAVYFCVYKMNQCICGNPSFFLRFFVPRNYAVFRKYIFKNRTHIPRFHISIRATHTHTVWKYSHPLFFIILTSVTAEDVVFFGLGKLCRRSGYFGCRGRSPTATIGRNVKEGIKYRTLTIFCAWVSTVEMVVISNSNRTSVLQRGSGVQLKKGLRGCRRCIRMEEKWKSLNLNASQLFVDKRWRVWGRPMVGRSRVENFRIYDPLTLVRSAAPMTLFEFQVRFGCFIYTHFLCQFLILL